MAKALLETKSLCAFYGHTQILFGVDLTVEEGGVTTLLGANGAGKTTMLRAISGLVRTTGQVAFLGEGLAGRAAEDIARKGVAHVPQGRGTFLRRTVEENLQIGAMTRRDFSSIAADVERVYGYFPRLRERCRQQAGTLSGGEQQMLAVARALMLRPKLLLLDEPSFGLAPLIVQELFGVLRTLNQADGLAMLVVEQNASLALDLADHAFLIETGHLVRQGPARELRDDEDVRRAYLGY
jgi:branched-chain amino acid transport system ATP-binding protein